MPLPGCAMAANTTSNTPMGSAHVPVKIFMMNALGNWSTVSKAYPRRVLLAASKTMAARLQPASGKFVQNVSIDQNDATRPAVARILKWIFDLNLPKRIDEPPQIPIHDYDTFDTLTQLLQAVVYFDLRGKLGNQHELRHKIWDHLNGDTLGKEDVVMVWDRLRFAPKLRARCFHAFVDLVDNEQAQSGQDLWVEYEVFFGQHHVGLFKQINAIRRKKEYRLRHKAQEQTE